MIDRATQAQIEWAHEYNGYTRIARDPNALYDVIRPAQAEYNRTGEIPDWCGVDFLRAWAFYLVRADRHSGGGSLGRAWDAVLDALRQHPDAERSDVPPPHATD